VTGIRIIEGSDIIEGLLLGSNLLSVTSLPLLASLGVLCPEDPDADVFEGGGSSCHPQSYHLHVPSFLACRSPIYRGHSLRHASLPIPYKVISRGEKMEWGGRK
jgi:hypothetical protein